jgi:hypothetical protein
VRGLVDDGHKVLVFGNYTAPLMEIREEFGDAAVMITGEVSERDRKAAKDRFQDDPSVKVFVGGLKSAGEGITLTAADKVVFLDMDWVPDAHRQAQDRAIRNGQRKSVDVYYMVARLKEKGVPNVDDALKAVHDAKNANYGGLFGDVSSKASHEIVWDELMRMVKGKAVLTP